MESTKSMLNFPFLLIIKGVSFPERSKYHLSMLGPIFTQILKYIGNGTRCTLYAIIPQKLYILKLYNQNNMIMTAILRKTCHHAWMVGCKHNVYMSFNHTNIFSRAQD